MMLFFHYTQAKDITFITYSESQFAIPVEEVDSSLSSTLQSHTAEPVERGVKDLILKPKDDKYYSIEEKLQDGYTVDTTHLTWLLEKALQTNENVSITIPYTVTRSKVYMIVDGKRQELQILSDGVSDFSGSSPNRIHNIETAVKQFDGLRLAPGESFSFNEYLGEVEKETGYKLELVIKGPRTIPDYGGGVCQVSTTVYRAALAAGLPINERKAHSYAVSYYEPWGSDATIYPGVVDLQFTNDYDDPVILHGYSEGSKLHFNLYGTADDRTVEISGPNIYGHMSAPNPTVEKVTTLPPGKRVWKEFGHNGFHASWERVINNNGTTTTEDFISIYEARGGYVLEGVQETVRSEESSEV